MSDHLLIDPVQIIVRGKPQSLARHRHTKRGFNYDPSKKDKHIFLEKAIKSSLPVTPFTGAITMVIKFYFDRPKNHYRTGKYKDIIKPSAPHHHTNTPDIDNCIKFVCDALNGVYYMDDRQIDHIDAYQNYSNSHQPRTEVYIMEGQKLCKKCKL